MKTLIELNIDLFLISCGILFFILRYHVHLHIEYQPRQRSRRNPRRVTPVPAPIVESTPVSAKIRADLESALRNMGCTEKEAKERAGQAIADGPGDFDALILRAMRASTSPRRHS